MTMEKKTLEYALNALKEIEAEIIDDAIKDKEFPPLVNMKTMEDIGFAVILHLNGKYDYSDKLLDEWKEKLCADEYSITLKNKQLQVKFKVRYETGK